MRLEDEYEEPEKTAQNLELSDDAKDDGVGTENHTHTHESMNQLNQEFHKSLDLKSLVDSSPIELNDGSNLSLKQTELPDKKERRYALEMETTRNENDPYLDLKLSLPGVYLRGKLSNESKSSSLTSQGSCISAEVESTVNSENNLPVEGSPLIVMGCTLCLLYVMVPDADPRCPKCNNSGLLDIFRGNQTKRSKKN